MRSAAGHGLPPQKKANSGRFGSVCAPLRGSKLAEPPPNSTPPPPYPHPRALPYPLCTRGYCRPYRNAQRRSVGAGDAKEVRTHPSPQCCAVGIPLLCAPTPHPTPHCFLCALPPLHTALPRGCGQFPHPSAHPTPWERGQSSLWGPAGCPHTPKKPRRRSAPAQRAAQGGGFTTHPQPSSLGQAPPTIPLPARGPPKRQRPSTGWPRSAGVWLCHHPGADGGGLGFLCHCPISSRPPQH